MSIPWTYRRFVLRKIKGEYMRRLVPNIWITSIVIIMVSCADSEPTSPNTTQDPTDTLINHAATRSPDSTMHELPPMADAVDVLNYVFSEVESLIETGIKTQDIEDRVSLILAESESTGYFKGYYGYPNVTSVPVNEETVHTPPSSRVLREGDIVTLETGVFKDGQYAFQAWTYPVGMVDVASASLLLDSETALREGVKAVMPERPVSDISKAIHQSLGSSGLEPSRDFVGYKIGSEALLPPKIPCFFGPNEPLGPKAQPSDRFVVLVISHSGSSEVRVASDGWTVYPIDRQRSAVFSHMVEVTETGHRILTHPRQ